MSTVNMNANFQTRTAGILADLASSGQLKHLQMIESPMDATISLRDYGEVVCLCSNNYLGLANHPEVVEAGIDGLRQFGAGTASVRFICGTFACHEKLERTIAQFHGVEAAYSLQVVGMQMRRPSRRSANQVTSSFLMN